MKKQKKYVLSVVSFVFIFLFLLPSLTTQAATSGSCGDKATYTLSDDGTLTIRGIGSINGTFIKDQVSSIKSMIIEEGITAIEGFSDYTYLETVSLPYSLTFIKDKAFSHCSKLVKINLPNSISHIGKYAFSYCTSLKDVTLPYSLSELEAYAFEYCSSLTSINIPASLIDCAVEESHDRCYASFYMSGLKTVTFDKDTFRIPQDLLSYCINLETVTIPESVGCISPYAFYRCIALNSVKLPSNLNSLGYEAFAECWNLKSINIPNTLSRIDNGWIEPMSYRTLRGPFSYSGIESATIQNGCKEIVNQLFQDCTKLSSIAIPSTVKTIGDYAFNNSKLREINIPDSVTTIGDHAFSYCVYLSSIKLPSKLKSLGAFSLYYTGDLKPITIPPTCSKIGSNLFYSSCVDWIYGTKSSEAYKIAKQYSIPFKEYHFEGATYTVGKGIYKITKDLNKNGTVTFVKPDKTTYTNFTIPSTVKIAGRTYKVTSIGANAFKNNKKLKTLTIKSSTITSIGAGAFTNMYAKAKINVPKKKASAYKKLMTSKTGYKKTMTIIKK